MDRLKADISGRFEASTGRRLNIFLDRDSIGWGDDWRERIRDSVLAATFFIPVVTMRFFRSDACREELSTYYENARQLGVTELILPIILAGVDLISPNHENEDVRLIERLNYIPIEAEWESGYSSPEWGRVINRMVRELASALSRAETALIEREQEEVEQTPEPAPDDLDLDQLAASVTETFEDLVLSTQTMTDFGNAVTAATEALGSANTTTESQAVQLLGVRRMSESATSFAQAAEQFERHATETDSRLRAIIRELRGINSPVAAAQLGALAESTRDFPDVDLQVESIDQAVDGLRLVSMANVSTRKALQPAIRAFQSMRIGMRIVLGWREL